MIKEDEEIKSLFNNIKKYNIIIISCIFIIMLLSILIVIELIEDKEEKELQEQIKEHIDYDLDNCLLAYAGSNIPNNYFRYNQTHYCLEDVYNE